MTKYEKNFDKVLRSIEEVRIETNEHQIIKIVAASKYANAEEIRNFYNIGQRAFGENRVQDMKEKCSQLEDLPLEWHFIGRLQSNKINTLLDLNVSLIQSCESFQMAKEIDKRAKAKGIKQQILLQINSAKEESKAGIDPDLAYEEYIKIAQELENVTLKGVMSIGAHTQDEKLIRKSFENTFKIFEKLQPYKAKYCSMGMSGDYILAIKCGSNMLRLGSTLFN